MEKLLKNSIEWIRWYQKELIFGSIIFVVASLSFGFGYLAHRRLSHAPIIIEKCAESTTSSQP
jgi:hypothetical protein